MSDYCETPEFYDERRVVARKVHACCECHRAIPIGVTYVRCCFKFDGEFCEERQHVECRDFAAKVNLDYLGECLIPFGAVESALQSPDDYGIDFDELITSEQWNAFREEWARIKVLYPERMTA